MSRVSIIMPCYNAAAHLPSSVGSVHGQTLGDWELIIVDDGSTYTSRQELERLAATDPRLRVFHQSNVGAAAARNRALREVRGIYTAFLDADDTWHPEFLETMVTALNGNANATIAYCGWQNLRPGGSNDAPFVPPDYENSSKIEALLGGCRWPIHAAMVRSPAIHDCGGFDESLSSCMDYDLWLRMATLHRLVRVPKVLAYYHHHGGGQITHDRVRIALNHRRVQQKYVRANPALRQRLGNHRITELTDGELLKRAYVCYWQRDLPAARQLFRAVMARGYGTAGDWQHMLPALLPLSLHWMLIRLTQRSQEEVATSLRPKTALADGTPPRISIIMPCYNAAAHLPLSVGSVHAQTCTDWELIAVDDGSSDDTLAWLQAQTDSRVRVYGQTNQGVSAARNAGLALARGQYVAFLDADDTWDPDFLSKMSAALEQRPDTVLAYCGWQNVGLEGPRGEPFTPPDYETPAKRVALFTGCRWPIHAALTQRAAILAAGGFNPRLKNAEDYALWLEIAATAPILRVPEVLSHYHFHGGGLASNHHARAALHQLHAQQAYLTQHPDFAAHLGHTRRRELLYGKLLEEGYKNYWKHDLATARTLFRRVMRAGYGRAQDLKYMLPALLPLPLHKLLLRMLENDLHKTPQEPGTRT